MDSYKFKSKISNSGLVKIQVDNKNLFNQEVEVIILPTKPKKRKITASEFIQKWAGFLSEEDIDKAKFDYLSNKYK